MRERISKGIFWLVSFGSILIGIYFGFFRLMIINSLLSFFMGMITNPYLIDYISKKIGVEINDYYYGVKMLFTWTIIFLILEVAMIIFKSLNMGAADEKTALQEFEAILKMLVFISYFIILFMYKSEDKRSKYIIFGLFYLGCIILSFASKSINEEIIKFLNTSLGVGGLDIETYELFKNGILMPIKEAILTYIIFDTVMGDCHKKIDKNEKTTIKETSSTTKEVDGNEDALIGETFEINVFDNDFKKNLNFKIQVRKR